MDIVLDRIYYVNFMNRMMRFFLKNNLKIEMGVIRNFKVR